MRWQLWSSVRGEEREREFVFVPEEVERAVEPSSEDDLGTRRGQGGIRTQKLNEASVERDGPVVVNLPSFLEAEDVVEIDAKSGTMNVRDPIGVSEAPVVVIGEKTFEQLVGMFDAGDVLLPQVFDETILMSAIRAFDASLSLWRMGIDKVNAKPSHRQAERC